MPDQAGAPVFPRSYPRAHVCCPASAMTATSLRRPWMIVQLALIAAGLAIAILFTVVSPSSPPPSFRPATLGDQPPGAVVLGKEDGGLAVGIAAAPRHGQMLVVATVFGQDGSGATGLRTSLAIATRDGQHMTASASPCTAGCYQAVFSTSELPKRITVAFNGRSRVGFTLPPHGPSASALHLVHGAGAEYRRIRTLVTHERLGSDLTHVAYTTYYAVAPDRLHFVVRGEEQSIIIGNRRWDKSLGGTWQGSPQTPIKPIAPYWAPLVQDATILGTVSVHGRPCWEIAFADPQTPGFFTIWVDKSNDRTLELEMTAPAHFMHHSYGPFNAPLKVQPPST